MLLTPVVMIRNFPQNKSCGCFYNPCQFLIPQGLPNAKGAFALEQSAPLKWTL